MTSRAIRELRRPSVHRPTSARATDRIKDTYKAWCAMLDTYRKWVFDRGNPARNNATPPVVLRWVASFDDFLEDMGERPAGTTLRLIDTKAPYGPGNCRWGSQKKKGRHPKIHITHAGQTRTVQEWSALLNTPYSTIYGRLCRGMSGAEALGLVSEVA